MGKSIIINGANFSQNKIAETVFSDSEKIRIDVLSNISEYGNVYGTGLYDENQQITINAIANKGYKFVKWLDNNSTDALRVIKVSPAITAYVAIFEESEEIYTTPDEEALFTELQTNAEINAFSTNTASGKNGRNTRVCSYASSILSTLNSKYSLIRITLIEPYRRFVPISVINGTGQYTYGWVNDEIMELTIGTGCTKVAFNISNENNDSAVFESTNLTLYISKIRLIE